MYDPGVVKVLETLHDLEDVSGGKGLVQLMVHREIVVEALTLTTEEKQSIKMSVTLSHTYLYHTHIKIIYPARCKQVKVMWVIEHRKVFQHLF